MTDPTTDPPAAGATDPPAAGATDPATDPATEPATEPATDSADLEAAEAAAEDGPDLDLNVNDGDPLPPDDIDDGQDD